MGGLNGTLCHIWDQLQGNYIGYLDLLSLIFYRDYPIGII